VTIEQRGPVVVVKLNRPARANAMDAQMPEALLAAFEVASHLGARALVLTGEGNAFSAGGDVSTIRAMRTDPELRHTVLADHHELFKTMAGLPCPIVAAINGAAVGAGVTIALLCDLVVMAEHAYLCDPRVALGLLDGAGGFVLWPLLTSLSAAKQHLLLGDRIDGAEAFRIGLANRVVPGPQLLDEALRLANRLAGLPPHATREARRLLNTRLIESAALLDDSARAEHACFDTEEHRHAVERLLSARLDAEQARSS
jgi:enoyl-CoA hydratase